MWIWIRNTAFFLTNLRICELWDTKEICVFAIRGLIIANLRIGTHQKFVDL